MDLKSYLDQEMISSEKKRLNIFMGVIAAAMMVFMIYWLFFREVLMTAFVHYKVLVSVPVMGLSAIVILSLSKRMVVKHESQKCCLSGNYKRYSVFIELLIPSMWLVGVAILEQTARFLDSPMIYIYFLMITVSSLHLDFKLSFYIGLGLALFHSIFVELLAWSSFGLNPVNVFMYHVRSTMFLLNGICAGLVALELKNRMIASFQHIKEKQDIETLFSQQVSKEVVDALKSREDFTASHEVTIVFLDIRGFTQRVQGLAPKEVIKFQNDFFSPIIQIINEHKGVTNQVLGDGLMATFGEPIEDSAHAEYALDAVNDIFEFLEDFNQSHADQMPLRIGVGVHSGDVIVGNIGTEERKQFSVSGMPVIITSRIEQLNKTYGSSILISRQFYDKVKHKIKRNVNDMGLVELKGIEDQIEILQLETNMDVAFEKTLQQ